MVSDTTDPGERDEGRPPRAGEGGPADRARNPDDTAPDSADSTRDTATGERVQAAGEPPDRARSGAPASGQAVHDRFSSDEIFQRVVASADEEVDSTTRELFFSGLAAGLAITLTFLAHAAVKALVPGEGIPTLVGALLYPIGFVFIILGRYQLYTENTLPPVALVLTRLASLPALLRVWGAVLIGNFLGAAVGVFILASTSVLSPEAATVAAEFGREGLATDWWDLFFKAVFAGLLVAGVVWLDHAARDTISRFWLVYLVFFTIPAAGLYHVVVSFADAFYLVLASDVALLPVLGQFVLPVLLGNTAGGVVLVALVNYAQTRDRRLPKHDVDSRLPPREWLFGGFGAPRHVVTSSEDD